MMSSGHTGECAIHSSDFSAFTKRSHGPSLLRFLTQLLPLRLSICTSATASVELCSPRGEVPWSFAAVNRVSSRFIAREDPHSKCIKCLGFSHAREAVYGTSKCKICDDFRLITLRSRLEDYERESSIVPRRASSTSAAPREIAASREPAASRRAADFTNLVGSVEQGYTAMPVIEDTLALTSFTLFGSFLEVPPPPSFQAV